MSRDDAVAKATARARHLQRHSPGQSLGDVAELVAWFSEFARTTRKRRTGEMRSPVTTRGYEVTLDLFEDLARYRPGDPRVTALGLEPGSSMRCDDPELGIGPADLVALVDERAGINLRTRAADMRALARWEATVARAEATARPGHRPRPAGSRPHPRPEVASARTIEEFARAVKSMLVEAYRRGRIPYQPWTAEVDDAVVRAQCPHYTSKNVLHRDQVWRVAAAVATLQRTAVGRGGVAVVHQGGRYAAMIALAGRKGLRPEETIARPTQLAGARPGAAPDCPAHNAEVYHPLAGGGRVRAAVPLKHRPDGEVRYVYLDDADDDPQLLELLRGHLDRYVAEPDETSPQPDARDPYMFTTTTGLPLILSNWGAEVVAAGCDDRATVGTHSPRPAAREEVAQTVDAPERPSRRPQPTKRPVPYDRGHRLATEDAASRLAHERCLVGDQFGPVVVQAEGAPDPRMRGTRECPLVVRRPQADALGRRFQAGERHEHPYHGQSKVRRGVDRLGDTYQGDPVALARLPQLLELAWATNEPIELPHADRVAAPSFDRRHEARVARTVNVLVGGDVHIPKGRHHRPVPGRGERTAGGLLPLVGALVAERSLETRL